MISKLWRKLRNRQYRKAFVDSQLKMGVPFQIHELRKKRGWSQARLAQEAGLTQGVISRAENPEYGNLAFNTVLAIAGGFDVAFIGAFVPFSKLEEWHRLLSEETIVVPQFEEEDRQQIEGSQVRSRATMEVMRRQALNSDATAGLGLRVVVHNQEPIQTKLFRPELTEVMTAVERGGDSQSTFGAALAQR